MTEIVIEWLRNWGNLSLSSGIALGFIFVVANFVPFPRTFLCFGAGTIFGLWAIPIIATSTTVGGVLCFLSARHLLADRLQRRLDQQPRLRAVADVIDGESWRVVALLRLGSPIPTIVQNCFFGITRIRLRPYAFATFVFTIPQIVLYVYIGALGRAALMDDSSSSLNRGLMGIGAVCLITVVFLIWRKARIALAGTATMPVRLPTRNLV